MEKSDGAPKMVPDASMYIHIDRYDAMQSTAPPVTLVVKLDWANINQKLAQAINDNSLTSSSRTVSRISISSMRAIPRDEAQGASVPLMRNAMTMYDAKTKGPAERPLQAFAPGIETGDAAHSLVLVVQHVITRSAPGDTNLDMATGRKVLADTLYETLGNRPRVLRMRSHWHDRLAQRELAGPNGVAIKSAHAFSYTKKAPVAHSIDETGAALPGFDYAVNAMAMVTSETRDKQTKRDTGAEARLPSIEDRMFHTQVSWRRMDSADRYRRGAPLETPFDVVRRYEPDATVKHVYKWITLDHARAIAEMVMPGDKQYVDPDHFSRLLEWLIANETFRDFSALEATLTFELEPSTPGDAPSRVDIPVVAARLETFDDQVTSTTPFLDAFVRGYQKTGLESAQSSGLAITAHGITSKEAKSPVERLRYALDADIGMRDLQRECARLSNAHETYMQMITGNPLPPWLGALYTIVYYEHYTSKVPSIMRFHPSIEKAIEDKSASNRVSHGMSFRTLIAQASAPVISEAIPEAEKHVQGKKRAEPPSPPMRQDSGSPVEHRMKRARIGDSPVGDGSGSVTGIPFDTSEWDSMGDTLSLMAADAATLQVIEDEEVARKQAEELEIFNRALRGEDEQKENENENWSMFDDLGEGNYDDENLPPPGSPGLFAPLGRVTAMPLAANTPPGSPSSSPSSSSSSPKYTHQPETPFIAPFVTLLLEQPLVGYIRERHGNLGAMCALFSNQARWMVKNGVLNVFGPFAHLLAGAKISDYTDALDWHRAPPPVPARGMWPDFEPEFILVPHDASKQPVRWSHLRGVSPVDIVYSKNNLLTASMQGVGPVRHVYLNVRHRASQHYLFSMPGLLVTEVGQSLVAHRSLSGVVRALSKVITDDTAWRIMQPVWHTKRLVPMAYRVRVYSNRNPELVVARAMIISANHPLCNNPLARAAMRITVTQLARLVNTLRDGHELMPLTLVDHYSDLDDTLGTGDLPAADLSDQELALADLMAVYVHPLVGGSASATHGNPDAGTHPSAPKI